MGPAPMIRMVEMSVLLGIKSRGNRESGTKKGRACRASLEKTALGYPRARLSLDQIPHPRKVLKGPINRHFGRSARARLRLSGYAGQPSPQLAGLPTEAAKRRRLEARPGFEPG